MTPLVTSQHAQLVKADTAAAATQPATQWVNIHVEYRTLQCPTRFLRRAGATPALHEGVEGWSESSNPVQGGLGGTDRGRGATEDRARGIVEEM